MKLAEPSPDPESPESTIHDTLDVAAHAQPSPVPIEIAIGEEVPSNPKVVVLAVADRLPQGLVGVTQ